MALIPCPDPECGKKVSSMAAVCPHCGCPLIPTTQSAPQASSPSDATEALLREQLCEWKTRYSAIDLKTSGAEQQAYSLLMEAEDLLIHVVGQSRYDSLIQQAREAIDLEAERLRLYKEFQQAGGKRTFFGHTYGPRPAHEEASEMADRAVENLKRRVAGIEFRK